MTTDFRAELQALVDAYDENGGKWPQHHEYGLFVAFKRARATLAKPEPEGPTDEELDLLADCHMITDGETGAVSLEHLDYARAVLARWGRSDGPAVPDGREPASVASEPSDAGPAYGEVAELVAWLRRVAAEVEAEDYATVYSFHLPTSAADLLERLDRYDQALSAVMPSDFKDWWENSKDEWPDVAAGVIESLRKREELAWEQVGRLSPPQPVAEPPLPEQGEVIKNADTGVIYVRDGDQWLITQPVPQPVPVAERLPGLEDCDGEGRCWLCGKVEGDWRLLNPEKSGVPQLKYCFSHWLPAHALPVPQ